MRLKASDRKEITDKLSKAVELRINPHNDPRIYWSKEVTFYSYTTGGNSIVNSSVRVDYMEFKPVNLTVSGIEHGDVYVYEVKSCIDDHKSGNGLNFIGDYNYLVMPEELYAELKDHIPYRVGVLCPEDMSAEVWKLRSVKPTKRTDRIYPLSTVLLAMFRSANRDRK